MYNIVEYMNPNFFLEYRKQKITYHGTTENINQINGCPKVIGSFGVPGGGCNLDLLILSIEITPILVCKREPKWIPNKSSAEEYAHALHWIWMVGTLSFMERKRNYGSND
jgi:hypothetical protein